MDFNNINLVLHGLAIAAIPADKQQITRIVCTPISIDYRKPRAFDVLNNFSFTEEVDLTDLRSVTGAFVKTISVLDQVVSLQKAAFDNYDPASYQPVALVLGMDSRHPINPEVVFMSLFGEEAPILSGREEVPILMAAAKAKRELFFTNQGFHTENTDYRHACWKLATLLGQCSLNWGNFGKVSIGESTTEIEQNDADLYLLELKPFLDKGSAQAHQLACSYARDAGIALGEYLLKFKNE